MQLKFLSSALSLLGVGYLYAESWGYKAHNGLDVWAKLDPQFSVCQSG